MRPVSRVERENPLSLSEVVIVVLVCVVMAVVIVIPYLCLAFLEFADKCVRECIDEFTGENK